MNSIVFLNQNLDFDIISIGTPSTTTKQQQIHLRLQMRNARKSITIVQGIAPEDAKVMVRYLRKTLSTNGNICKDDDDNIIVQFQGDKRAEIKKYLIDNSLGDAENIKIHGF
jgi:translation initiation factor 1